MDMNDSSGGGRISLALDAETVQCINNMGRAAAAGNAAAVPMNAARTSVDSGFKGTYLDIGLTGAVQMSKTVSVEEGAVVTFDALPAGAAVRVKGTVWMNDAAGSRVVCGEGISEPIVIQEGDNRATLPLALINKFYPLTLEALADGTINFQNPWSTLKYTRNGGSLTAVTGAGGSSGSISVASGDKICLFAETSENGSLSMVIVPGVVCSVYGNVMSLVTLSGTEWNPNAAELTTEKTFAYLFSSADNIKNHSSKELCLPAVTLTKNCYDNMFYGCTSLTAAPVLPAVTLAEACYQCMFSECISLAAAPALPAVTLEKSCYSEMFVECISLTAAPVLPAATLAEDCYQAMFAGCSGLNKITCLATDLSATDCLLYWVKDGVNPFSTSGTFYKAASATGWTTGVSGIPSGWTTVDYSGN